MGNPSYIATIKKNINIPILRKEFIIDPIQVIESVHLKADAILLIASILTQEKCQILINKAHHLNLDILLEVHNQEELEIALSLNHIKIIGINNRDLNTFQTDTKKSLDLIKIIQKSNFKGVIVSESGYFEEKQLIKLQNTSCKAVLIGEGLVKNKSLLNFFKQKKTTCKKSSRCVKFQETCSSKYVE